jgi:uncharacterized protein (TIGR01777 family)
MGADFSSPERFILAGGSGFLGGRLSQALRAKGHDVVVLTRSPKSRFDGVREIAWDGKTVGAWERELDGARAVVNLTGRSVNCRYTAANRKEILESRVHSVQALSAVWRQCPTPPGVWVQAGSLAIYGNTSTHTDETAPHGDGFSVQVCEAWEDSLMNAVLPATRRVILRIGLALDPGQGALMVLEKLVKSFLGGTVGNGRQYMSWIHWRDLNEMFLQSIRDETISGVYNATSPGPVTNAEFMRELRRALHRPWSPPAPEFAVRIGSWFMRTEASLALNGRRCVPGRFLQHGFRFQFPELRRAMRDLYAGQDR